MEQQNLNNHIPEDLLNKLNKLKALKESAEAVGSHEEAANAAAKYQEMLIKYNLDEQAVLDHGVAKKAQMLSSEYDLDLEQGKSEAGWLEQLIKVIAYFSFCKIVKTPGYRHRYDQGILTVLGEKHNVAVVFYMVEQIINKIRISCNIAYKNYKGAESRNTFRRGFLLGAVRAIGDRLYDQRVEMMKEQAMKEDKPVANTQMGLMIVSKEALVKRFMEDKFPNLTYGKSRRKGSMSEDGRKEGYAAGSKMELNQGLADQNRTKGFLK